MTKSRAESEPSTARVQPTAERGQHDTLEYAEVTVFSELGRRSTSKALVHRVRTQRVIDRLWSAGLLTDQQFTAAAKFWGLYHLSGMSAGRASTLEGHLNRAGGGPQWLNADRAMVARDEWRRALRAIPARFSGVFVLAVVEDLPLRQIVARRGVAVGGRQVRAALEDLRAALDALAAHWRS